MKIIMKTTSAGPDGVRYPGRTYDVSAQEGRELVAGGYATAVDAPAAKGPAKGPDKDPAKDPAKDPEKDPEKDAGKQAKGPAT